MLTLEVILTEQQITIDDLGTILDAQGKPLKDTPVVKDIYTGEVMGSIAASLT